MSSPAYPQDVVLCGAVTVLLGSIALPWKKVAEALPRRTVERAGELVQGRDALKEICGECNAHV